ncbi:MAG: HAD family phosphatase [Clostridia bacterium]|nr:HAD family phosphatase [Clostridia bacterium]
MKISGAIIDLDDTLTSSEWVWDGIPEKFLKRHGKTPEPGLDDTLRTLNTVQIGEYFKEHYFKDSFRSANSIVLEFGLIGAPYYFFKVPLQPGAKELVKQLHKDGVKMMILSANTTTLVKADLFRTGLLRYFDVFLCGSDPKNAKDDPKAFENARAILGTPKEETVVFEDSLYAIETAHSAGFPCIAMKGEKHSPETVKKLEELTEFCVSDFRDILDQLN